MAFENRGLASGNSGLERSSSDDSEEEQKAKHASAHHQKKQGAKREQPKKLPIAEKIASALGQSRPPEAVRAEQAKPRRKKKKKPGEVAPVELNEAEVEREPDLEAEKPKEKRPEEAETGHKSRAEKRKAKKQETAEIEEVGPQPEERAPDYQIGEFVEVKLDKEGLTEAVLRLPELPTEETAADSSKKAEGGEWSLAEAIEEAGERLAAEAAGVQLPAYSASERVLQPLQTTQASGKEKPAATTEEVETEQVETGTLGTPEEIMEAVAAAYEIETDEGGSGNLRTSETRTVEKVVERDRAPAQKPAGQEGKVLKKLTGMEGFAHQKFKQIKSLNERSIRQNSFPNRRDEKLDHIFRDQVRFEDRRLEDERMHRAHERLVARKSTIFDKKNLPNEERLIEEQFELPDDRRLERSAWLSIEVDKKTGREVSDPSIEYGDEYYREKQPEARGEEPAEVAVASGQLAVGGTGSVNISSHSAAGSMGAKLADKSSNLYNKIESTLPIRNRSTAGADLALWVALFLVIAAIIIVANI